MRGREEWAGPGRLLAELGAGGMGRVFLASGPDGSLVAVKQIDPRYAEDKGFRARFEREVAACRRVSGAYTAAVVAAGPDAARPWLASVYVPGPSLAEALEAVGTLPEESAVHLTARLASALADIHRAGLVHRDLKPSNVLLAEDGLRVIDFGIVRAIDAGSGDQTLTTLPIGWPAYMSPEQAQLRPITTASDLFGLGVLLTVACTGRNPFHVPGNVEASLRNIVQAQPDLTGVPARLRPIVERCLAKDPAARPTPAQVLALLGAITPTSRPWPPAVYDLIARHRADVDRLLSGAPEPTQVFAGEAPERGPSFEPATRADRGEQNGPVLPPARRSRPALALWFGAGGAVLALAAVLVLALGRDWLTAALNPGAVDSPSPSPTPAVGAIHGPDGKCVDVGGGFDTNGTPILMYQCHGGVAQRWTALDGQLIDSNSGRCLDVPEWDGTDWGPKLQIWDCSGGANQKWQLPS